MGKTTEHGEWCTDCGGVGKRLVTEGVSSPWEGVLVTCETCQGVGYLVPKPKQVVEEEKLAALEKAELAALRAFHQFFYHRAEALFADYGEEAVALYSAAAKAHRETQSIDYRLPPCSGDKDDCQGSAIWPDEE